MGNLHETTSFIRTKGDTEEYSYVSTPRVDKIYLKTTKTFEITAIGLCDPIKKRPTTATIEISELENADKQFSQIVTLEKNSNRIDRYYELRKPFQIVKGKHYKIMVEVVGGPTYSYLDFCRYSTHRDIVIEISRNPLLLKPGLASEAGVNSLVSITSNRSKTTATTQMSRSETDLDHYEAKNASRRTKKKGTLQPGSLREIDENESNATEKIERKKEKKRTLTPESLGEIDENESLAPEEVERKLFKHRTELAKSDILTKSQRTPVRSLTLLDNKNPSESMRLSHKKEKNLRMNLITGISFRFSNAWSCLKS